MEYISKQSLLADLNEATPRSYFAFETMVREYPTEDVVPVVHAHWKDEFDGYICSNCKKKFSDEMDFLRTPDEFPWTPKYCPDCGAKMDEEVNDA